jgi:hypothetical protein
MAPVQGGSQCLLSLRGRAGALNQEAQRVVQGLNDLFNGQHLRAGCAELDGQWVAVQPPADRQDPGYAIVVHHEVGPYGVGPLEEELHRIDVLGGRRMGARLCGKWRDGPQHLSGNPERSPTCRHDGQIGAAD